MKFKIPNTSGVAGFWFVVWFLFTNILPGQGIVDDDNPVGYIAFFCLLVLVSPLMSSTERKNNSFTDDQHRPGTIMISKIIPSLLTRDFVGSDNGVVQTVVAKFWMRVNACIRQR
jgi:hypothetical protein